MTNRVTGIDSLKKRIMHLEQLQGQQLAEIKHSAREVASSVKPINLLKNALRGFAATPNIKSATLNTVLSIGAGFLGKKLYMGKSHSVVRKIAGATVQFLLTNFLRKKIPAVRENNLQQNKR